MPNECQSPRVAGANVTITIKGLAICNYNKNNRNWEAIFLRHVENHDLKIVVNKCRAGVLESTNSYLIDPDEKIYVVSNTASGQPVDYQAASGNDSVMDLSARQMYNGAVDFHTDKNFPLTFLSISGGIYYSKKATRKTYKILKAGRPVETRRIGISIGADIVCGAGGKTEIIVANRPNLIPVLFAEESVIYEIIFDNDCYEPVAYGECDFDKYFGLIKMPEQLILEPDEDMPAPAEAPEPEAPADEPPPKEPPCNSIIISDLGSGLNSLSELLKN